MPRKPKPVANSGGTTLDLRYLTEQAEAERELSRKNVEEVNRLNLVVGYKETQIQALHRELLIRQRAPFSMKLQIFGFTIGSLEIHGISMQQERPEEPSE